MNDEDKPDEERQPDWPRVAQPVPGDASALGAGMEVAADESGGGAPAEALEPTSQADSAADPDPLDEAE